MGEIDAGAVAIAVTELGTNIMKHGKSGRMVFEAVGNGTKGLRILALDKGPGIQNITTALEDGYSTSGTSGNGLGAVRRLSTHFDIYSLRDRGTCVLAEFWPKKKAPVGSSIRAIRRNFALRCAARRFAAMDGQAERPPITSI